MDSRSAASAEQAKQSETVTSLRDYTPVSWQVFASRHWGSNWVLGRKTEKAIKRYSKWDESSQTYKPPRFVPRYEYNHVRELWWSEVYKAQSIEIKRLNDLLSISDTAPLLETIEELKAEIGSLIGELEDLRSDVSNANAEGIASKDSEKELRADIPFVLSALYQGKPQEAILLLERIK